MHRQLLQQNEEHDDGARATWTRILVSSTEAGRIAQMIYEAERQRLVGLENKLRSQLNYVTALSPIVTALLAFALTAGKVLSVVLGGLALGQLLSAFLLTLRGTLAWRTHLITPDNLREIAQDPDRVSLELAARMMVAAESNQPIGIDLNNAIWAVWGALVRTVLLAGTAAGLLV